MQCHPRASRVLGRKTCWARRIREGEGGALSPSDRNVYTTRAAENERALK